MNSLFRVALLAVSLAITANIPATNAYEFNQQKMVDLNWKPSLATGDSIFPSLILATRNLDLHKILKTTPSPQYLGDSTGLFGVVFRNNAADTKIRIVISIDGLSEESVFEGVLRESNQEYTIMPYMRYKSAALAKVKQPYPTTITFAVSVNDAPAEQVTKNLNVKPVNDVPLYIKQGNKTQDTTLLFSAFVNENSPVIDKILKDALAHNAVDKFVGYDGDNQETVRQIFAIWNSLQRSNVRYSNIATPSGNSENVISQHVRLVDESVENSQANCVDGSVLLASALYKIGMCPVLVIKPTHMFLAVYDSKQSCERKNLQNLIFIETTEVGNISPLNIMQKKWRFKTADGYLESVSYRSLMAAISSGHATFNTMLTALQTKQLGYSLLDIKQLRGAGITPINSTNFIEQAVY